MSTHCRRRPRNTRWCSRYPGLALRCAVWFDKDRWPARSEKCHDSLRWHLCSLPPEPDDAVVADSIWRMGGALALREWVNAVQRAVPCPGQELRFGARFHDGDCLCSGDAVIWPRWNVAGTARRITSAEDYTALFGDYTSPPMHAACKSIVYPQPPLRASTRR